LKFSKSSEISSSRGISADLVGPALSLEHIFGGLTNLQELDSASVDSNCPSPLHAKFTRQSASNAMSHPAGK
ncbi:hypothetical protein ZYGM_000027, partial [Zygosaccharomyces mellis]